MEGRDSVFGDALESIIENVEQQTAEEAKKAKKKGAAEDPLKAGKPKELKGDKGGGKIQKMEAKDEKADEGIVPEEGKDDEATKIKKLTEIVNKLTEESNLTQDVTALIGKAKDALDKGEYDNARGFCDRLEQVQMAVSEPEAASPMEEPEMPPIPEEPMESNEESEATEEPEEPVENKDDPEKKEDKEAPLA